MKKKKTGEPPRKKTRDHSLRTLNVKRGFLSFFRLLSLALFLYAGCQYSLGQPENAIAVAVVGALSVVLTVLPAKKIYQEQWYLDKARVSLGEYAEEISLERRIMTEPDHFRMLCLFPTGRDDSQFSFSNRVSARCRQPPPPRHTRILRARAPSGREAAIPRLRRDAFSGREGLFFIQVLPRCRSGPLSSQARDSRPETLQYASS